MIKIYKVDSYRTEELHMINKNQVDSYRTEELQTINIIQEEENNHKQ